MCYTKINKTNALKRTHQTIKFHVIDSCQQTEVLSIKYNKQKIYIFFLSICFHFILVFVSHLRHIRNKTKKEDVISLLGKKL